MTRWTVTISKRSHFGNGLDIWDKDGNAPAQDIETIRRRVERTLNRQRPDAGLCGASRRSIMLLRETDGFKAERSVRGVRITTKERGAYPKSRVLPLKEWTGYLQNLPDESFNGACVFDFGIGTFRK